LQEKLIDRPLCHVIISKVVFATSDRSLPSRQPLENVITGYNTDVDFQGVTYHVQTEDKGLNSPMIMSLVYNGGTILLSKREPYDDLIKSGFSEKLLVERLRKQHKTLCAAVKKGRIDELRGLGKKSAAKQAESEPESAKPVKTPTKSQSKNSKA